VKLSTNSKSPEETERFGQDLVRHLRRGDIVLLRGDLGTGKTTLVKGVARALGVDPRSVTSPTFVLMHYYEGRWPLYHFDLYRLEDPAAVESVEYDEFFYGDGLSLVEWPERLGARLPPNYVKVDLRHTAFGHRKIEAVRVKDSA
jgi:tRNA threonylcarbamoyladenosine biosynthesis protein TsaE